jgi:hypothetical protein
VLVEEGSFWERVERALEAPPLGVAAELPQRARARAA